MNANSNNHFPVLQTPRLILRKLRPNDAEAILVLRSDDKVNKYLNRKATKSVKEAKTFIKEVNENIQNSKSFYWAITLHGIDEVIGTICLYNFTKNTPKAEIGFELLPKFQKNGMMYEAIMTVINYCIQDLKLESIYATTQIENKGSIAVLEKSGFKRSDLDHSVFEILLQPKIPH